MKNRVLRRMARLKALRIVTVCAMSLSFLWQAAPSFAAMVGWVDGTTQINGQTAVAGWACFQGSPYSVDVHVYAAGPYGTGTLVAVGTANLPSEPAVNNFCQSMTGNFRFAVPIPSIAQWQFPGQPLYVYGVCTPSHGSGCQNALVSNSGIYYLPYHFSASHPTGWSDGHNYFAEWGCTSPTGAINNIARLNIAPLGTHPANVWKDSLYADLTTYVGGNPVLFFTAGNKNSTPVFSLEKATFNGSAWVVTDLQDDPSNNGGISSQDGTESDYISNEYFIAGWGPVANKPGSQSLIPGVLETSTTSFTAAYPLWGAGPLGLTQVQSTLQHSDGDPNTRTCLHMNPTLFDYDASGRPQSFMAYLWTGPTTSTPCRLPDGTLLPNAAYYVYNYNPSTGWQLNLNYQLYGLIGDNGAGGAVNYNRNSGRKFTYAEWAGRIRIFDIDSGATSFPLDCTSAHVNFSEASGNDGLIYFLIDPPGGSSGLLPGVPVHDIYVAFRN